MRIVLALSGSILVTATAGLGGGHALAGTASDYHLDQVGTFQAPVHIDDAPGYPNLLFVVEQPGRVMVIKNGVKQTTPFLDIRSLVLGPTEGGEEGLLSIAFARDYQSSRRFYVFYVNGTGDIRVDEFRRSTASPLRADPGTRRRVIIIPHRQGKYHNGGQLQTTADGMLWLSIGDGGTQQDPEDDAQSITSLLGKLLRIDPTPAGGGSGYDIPANNPFAGAVAGADEIWSLGLRNPWRFSFDSGTGALVLGDVGGSSREEVDYTTVAGARRANFGWNDFEGRLETSFGIGANASPHTRPIYDYATNVGGTCSITGGYVVRDASLGPLAGKYIYSDYCAGWLKLIKVPTGVPFVTLDLDAGSPSSLGEGVGGQIYVANHRGPVYALEPN